MKETPKTLTSWATEVLEAFSATQALAKSDGTVAAYTYDVKKFLEYLCSRGIKTPKRMKATHVTMYLAQLKKEGRADASVCRYYMSLRAFFHFLRVQGELPIDLMRDIPAPKNALKAPDIPTVEDVQLLLAHPYTDTDDGLRDRAILELLYSSGLRASELCDLTLHDFAGDCIVVRCGKRDKTRTVPVTDEASYWIQLYIETARGTDRQWLFQTNLGKKLCRQQLNRIVVFHARDCGLGNLSTHTLRHACATHLLDGGADLRLIQEVLGHSSIASTQRYTHLSGAKMQTMFKQFHPRKGLETQNA